MILPGCSSWNELVLAHWTGNETAAIVTPELEVSGDALLAFAAGASAHLDEIGIARGTPVPALMDETPEAIAYTVGGALSGRPLAPLGTKLPEDDLVAIIVNLGTPHLLVSADRAEQGRSLAAGAGVTLHVIDRMPDPAPHLAGECEPDDIVVVVHTSGTTGLGKPVFLRQAPLTARIDVYQEVLGIGPGDRYCSASPYYHTAGVAMAVTALGMGTGIIPQDWFSLDNWRRAASLDVTCVLLVPTMIDILLDAGALTEASPKVLQYGAMPIHPNTLSAAVKALPDTRFLQIFGQTELSPICYLDDEGHRQAIAGRPELLTSVGRPIRGAELRIEDPDDDGIGQIAVRAAHAFVVDPDGWRRTGDLGIVDTEGYVRLHGRIGDRIIRGGENIYPGEIEDLLVARPDVREVAAVGIPDQRWGEIVRAYVVPSDPDDPPDPEALRAHCAANLAKFKVPAEIEFLAELPRNPSGKILRRHLR